MTTLESSPSTMASGMMTPNPMKLARRAMIDSQLRTSGVNADFVLARMAAVDRADFVPAAARATAYMDRAIRMDNGNALPAPLVQGMMLQEANPQGHETAIVVDCGSGYLAELLRPLVAEVISLTPEEAVTGKKGAKKADLLLIDGAVEHLPKPLLNRLTEDARILTGVVEDGVTRLAIGRNGPGGAPLFAVHDMGIPRLAAFDTPKSWSF